MTIQTKIVKRYTEQYKQQVVSEVLSLNQKTIQPSNHPPPPDQSLFSTLPGVSPKWSLKHLTK